MTAERLLATIQSRGCDARDIRDATHEATHAVQSGIRGRWERERLHAALERLAKRSAGRHLWVTEMVRYELQARAVEMLACALFDVPYNLDEWTMWCAMETAKTYRVDMGSLNDVADAIRIVSKQRRTMDLFDKVLSLRPARANPTPRDEMER